MKEVNKIIKDLKKGDIKPVYFLTGEIPFFIDRISDFIENDLLPEDAKSFDQMVFYGLDSKMEDIIMQAGRFPMMGDKLVLLVKEAQHLFKKQSDYDVLEEYLQNPSGQTLLVFSYKHKKPDGRKKVFKLIKEKGVWFEAKRMYDSDILKWIQETVEEMGFGIDVKSSQMLLEFLGADLSKIYNELQKLEILLEKGSVITPEIIEKNIGISKDYNSFELKSAIAQGDYIKAQKIINYFSANPKEHPLPAVIPVLYKFFKDLFLYHTLVDKTKYSVAKSLGVNPYFVGEYETGARYYPMKKITKIMGYLKQADIKSKGVDAGNMTYKDIINETIYKIMH